MLIEDMAPSIVPAGGRALALTLAVGKTGNGLSWGSWSVTGAMSARSLPDRC